MKTFNVIDDPYYPPKEYTPEEKERRDKVIKWWNDIFLRKPKYIDMSPTTTGNTHET